MNYRAGQDLWTAQRKRKKRIIVIFALIIPLAGLVFLIVRNNFSSEARAAAAPSAAEPGPSSGKGMDVFDGKDFRVVKQPGPADDAPPVESKYTVRLTDCFGVPLDEKNLVLKMSMDLEFDSSALVKEIRTRQEDLRVLVNLTVSKRKLDEIEMETLRPALISALNELLTAGDVKDIRFVDFRVERRLTEN